MSKLEAIAFLNNRGEHLVGVMHHGEGESPRPCLIICHGYAGTKVGGSRKFVDFARDAAKHNISVFRFDFAGSGDSDGELTDLTLDNEVADLHAAVTTVLGMDGVDPERVGVIGHCMGAVTAIRGSARDSRISKTVAWAPFVSLDETMERLIGEDAYCVLRDGDEADFLYNEQLFTAGPKILEESRVIDMAEELRNVRQPLLIIHGTEDATVPLADIQALLDSVKDAPGERRLDVLEGAHHSFPYHKEELFELTLSYFGALPHSHAKECL